MTTVRDNVDPAEVAKFNALASRWWDPGGEFRALHEINPLRLDWIRQHVDLSGKTVVDIGCGGGILTESMATAGATVTGIDMAEGPLAVAHLEAALALCRTNTVTMVTIGRIPDGNESDAIFGAAASPSELHGAASR